MHLYKPAKLAALSIGWNFVTAMDSLPHKAIAIKELALNRDRNVFLNRDGKAASLSSLPNVLYGHASEKRTFLETRTV